MSQPKSNMVTLGAFLGVLLLVGAGCAGATTPDTVQEQPQENQEQEQEFKNKIIVSNQAADASNVSIDTVIAKVDSWVVIHADSDGEPGEVIGYNRVQKGANQDIIVAIEKNKATEKLHAMLHIDAGEAGTYEFPGPDAPALDEAGNVVNRPFLTTADAPEQETNNEEETTSEPTEDTEDNRFGNEEVTNVNTQENTENRFGNEKVENVTLSKTFNIAAGSQVSYTVQKKWLNKPTEAVQGTTSKVSGSFSYNSADGSVDQLSAQVDSQSLSTGSGGRDGHVARLLGGPIKIASSKLTGLGPGLFKKDVPLQLTINGVTKTVTFSVEGNVSSDSMTANGQASINMNDFNVEPPSILGLYTVDENLQINFRIK